MRFGAVFKIRVCYGTVRCGFQMNPTVRFGNVLSPTVRLSAVFQNRKTYGAVRFDLKRAKILRCGLVRFEEGKNPTLRIGAVNRTEPHR